MRRRNLEFQGRLGDLPDDYAAAPLPPSREITGYDTTGTRKSAPGQPQSFSPALQTVFESFANLGPFQPLVIELFRAIQGKADFASVAFVVDTTAVVQLRPSEERHYMLIQNTSAATIYLGIGYAPTATTGIQLISGAVYEPYKTPQNEIYVLGSAAGQTGILLYAAG